MPRKARRRASGWLQPNPVELETPPGLGAWARARTATSRRDLVAVAARAARTGRGHLTLHLPEDWHREQEWLNLWDAACGPLTPAA